MIPKRSKNGGIVSRLLFTKMVFREKFNHLRSLVDGSAYATIAGLSLTEENYKTAIDLLQERFAQNQIIINLRMDAVLKLNGVSTMADIKKIRQIYDQLEIHVRGLQAQGVDSAQCGTLLTQARRSTPYPQPSILWRQLEIRRASKGL